MDESVAVEAVVATGVAGPVGTVRKSAGSSSSTLGTYQEDHSRTAWLASEG